MLTNQFGVKDGNFSADIDLNPLKNNPTTIAPNYQISLLLFLLKKYALRRGNWRNKLSTLINVFSYEITVLSG